MVKTTYLNQNRKRLKGLEDENRKLKQLVGVLVLDNQGLRFLFTKYSKAHRGSTEGRTGWRIARFLGLWFYASSGLAIDQDSAPAWVSHEAATRRSEGPPVCPASVYPFRRLSAPDKVCLDFQ
jgi:hypothetical protein